MDHLSSLGDVLGHLSVGIELLDLGFVHHVVGVVFVGFHRFLDHM
jgi:hypothetical protein